MNVNPFDRIDPTMYEEQPSVKDGHPTTGMSKVPDMTRGENPLDNSKLGLRYQTLIYDQKKLTESIHEIIKSGYSSE